MTARTSPSAGVFARWRARLFGERDAVQEQLADVAKEGVGMARLAHLCGSLMLFLFSLGSAVGICATLLDSLTHKGLTWASAPDAVALSVSVMLVLCMDVASLYASFKIRQLSTRREPAKAYVIHAVVIVVASMLESATFAYMSWLYDDPTVGIVAALILVRALAAPFFAIYLNSARAIPVGPRDILYQAELATGIGVLKDVVRVAADSSAPLARKLELFRASARMSDGDRSQLDGMIAVMSGRNVPSVVVDASDFSSARTLNEAGVAQSEDTAIDASIAPRASQREIAASSRGSTRPPTGGGSPAAAGGTNRRRGGATSRSYALELVAPPEWTDDAEESGAGAAQGSAHKAGVRTPRKRRNLRTASVEAKARKFWVPGMSVSQLEIAAGLSRNAAGEVSPHPHG